MKHLHLLIIAILICSCSSRKKTIENTTKHEAETKVIKKQDTLLDKEIEIEKKAKALDIDTIKESSEKEFNQVTKKRFITTHQLWDVLLLKYVSKNGTVNYKSFKAEHKKLLDYLYVLNLSFSNEAFKTLNKKEKLAFWINAYNAMTVDLILRHYPIKSIKDIEKPWKQRHWEFNGTWLNLNDIEHKILRKMNDPRIHFAIVCASISCPKLSDTAYTSDNLESKLTTATQEFLSDSTKNSITANNIELSKIFQWFAKDFKQNGSLIDFINQYLDIEISAKAKKTFKDYNWGLNE